MCLGIPMRVVEIDGANGVVEAGGLKKGVNLSLRKDVRCGDYVLVHAGFAIEKIKASEAKKTLDALKDMA